MTVTVLKAPWPYPGGKSKIAPVVWQRFGDVPNYVEPFMGSAAVLLARPPFEGNRIETVNDADGHVCVGPDTRILCGDLHWIKAGDVNPGMELLGFDESNGPAREGLRAPLSYRRWQLTTVTNVRRVKKPAYRLTFDDGTTVVASADHLWLGGSHVTGGRGWRWQKTESLVCNRTTQRSWVLKLCDVVEREETHDAGWLAGFFDGEGNLKPGSGWGINVTQKVGPELERAERLLKGRGYEVHTQHRQRKARLEIATILLNGGMRESLRFLMSIRPERLIDNLKRKLPTLSIYGRKHQAVGLVSKEYLGETEVIAIETASHTFVAEGLASHNCNFWRALQADPDAVAYYADWPVSELDLHARGDWLYYRPSAREWVEQLRADPEFYDAKSAGWWAWFVSCWIGALPQIHGRNQAGTPETGVYELVPHLGDAGTGVARQVPHQEAVARQRPHLGSGGQGNGVHGNVARQRPQLGGGLGQYGTGVHRGHGGGNRRAHLTAYMRQLSARLERVRVVCGDWTRVMGPSVTYKHGLTAVFLDPPYSAEAGRDNQIYSTDSGTVAHDVRQWCLENGDNPLLRIALCGYTGEGHEALEAHGWHAHAWKANGGYGSQGKGRGRANKHREVIWFSRHCLNPVNELPLFRAHANGNGATE